ncbi:MoaD/ThiS family protein [Cloacibacterium sp.]|jgi:molybdopterin converting factor small subunit|uniref:MoaD/ThiS family protein n=1 Tax=Cloacibacterium sp. TaxID=1913682 RepID=UPI0035AE56E5
MEIKTFGKITEIVNKEIELLFPMNLAELKTTLEEQFPLLKTLLYSIAINDELISDEDYMIIQPQSIALMPPFSGG